MDKSRRLPPLGAPSTRAPSSSEPPYAPLTFFDSKSSQPQPHSHPTQQHHQHPLPHPDLPQQSRPPPSTSSAPLFPPLSTPAHRSAHPPPSIPLSAEAISKPKKLHREVEQRRRMRMTEQIAELRQCVSDPNSGKTDKVSILQDAVAFVKAAKRTIHSLQFKLQAAESECARLVAILTELQPNLLRRQPHHTPVPLPAHPHSHHLPDASPLVVSPNAHLSTSHPRQLPSNAPIRASPFNFEPVAPPTSLREAAAAAAATRSITPSSEMLRTPIAQPGASWNTFASSAQPFSHAAVAASHPSPHFSHPLNRSHSQPLHSSLPHLRADQHQTHHHSFVGAHTGAPYTSVRDARPSPEPTTQLEQHPHLRHPGHLKPTSPLHRPPRTPVSRTIQGREAGAVAHPGDQASVSTPKSARHMQ